MLFFKLFLNILFICKNIKFIGINVKCFIKIDLILIFLKEFEV